MSIVQCLICGMNVPKHFWHMTVFTVSFLLNRTPSRSLQGKTPLHLLQPNFTLFFILPRLFGYTYFVHNRLLTRTKFDDKAVCCVFLVYSTMSKRYRCYDTVSQRLYHSLDVTFWKMFHSLQVLFAYRASMWQLFLPT